MFFLLSSIFPAGNNGLSTNIEMQYFYQNFLQEILGYIQNFTPDCNKHLYLNAHYILSSIFPARNNWLWPKIEAIQMTSGGEKKVQPSVKLLSETSYGLPNHGKFWSLFLKPSAAIWPSIFYQNYPIFQFSSNFLLLNLKK